MNGKGDNRRPLLISTEEEDLRWELAFKTKDNPKRKRQIVKRLKEIKNG